MKKHFILKEDAHIIKSHLEERQEVRAKFYISTASINQSSIVILSLGITKDCFELTSIVEGGIKSYDSVRHLGGGYIFKENESIIFSGSCKQNGAVPEKIIKLFEQEIINILQPKKVSTKIAEPYVKLANWQNLL